MASLSNLLGAAYVGDTGPQGPQGPQGEITLAGTTVVNPDISPSVVDNTAGDSTLLTAAFILPRAADVSIGSVTTGAPGGNASVTDIGSNGDVILDFTIPRGEDGAGVTYTRKTSAYTLVPDEGVIADTTAGSWTITLPLTPAVGDTVIIADGGDWSINNLTVARNGSTIEGDAEDLVMNLGGVQVQFTYDGTTWQTYVQAGALAGLGTTRVDFVATEGQTVFSVTYSPGFVDVYLNGIKLIAGTDFTATNGTTIVLTAGATAGDTVDVVAYDTFSVADTYSVAGADSTFVNVTGDTVTGDLVVTGSVTAGSFVGVPTQATAVWEAGTDTTESLISPAKNKGAFDTYFGASEQQVGVGQTWQTVTRTSGTTYQNTTGKPIMLSINGENTGNGGVSLSGDNIIFVFVGGCGGSNQRQWQGIIPDQWYYKYSGSTQTCAELR